MFQCFSILFKWSLGDEKILYIWVALMLTFLKGSWNTFQWNHRYNKTTQLLKTRSKSALGRKEGASRKLIRKNCAKANRSMDLRSVLLITRAKWYKYSRLCDITHLVLVSIQTNPDFQNNIFCAHYFKNLW